MLLVGMESSVLITDGRYGEQAARETAEAVDLVVSREGLTSAVGAEARGRGIGTIGVEALHVTLRGLERLREECSEVEWRGVEGWIEGERGRKDPSEVDAIERAVRLAEEVLAAFLEDVGPGDTERELAAGLEYRLQRAGSEGTAFDSIVASGPRSALPHARPSDRQLSEGDLLLVDCGAVVDGYCSDITRTVVLGEARPWQRELHQAVRRAQERALETLGPGVEAGAVDRAAREVLQEAGFGDEFSHSTGHGLGLEVHEAPRLNRGSEERLAPGHVVTVEPGAYLGGRGGVRIEDDVALEAEGTRRLTTFSRELMEL